MNLSGNKILIIGDLILDYYRFLEAERVSPEAPIVVFAEKEVQWRFGGAANVANNLKAMGVDDVKLFTVVGEDFDEYKNSISFVENLHGSHFNGKIASFVEPIICPRRKTTVKERFIARSQQVLRVDSQTREPVPESIFRGMIQRVIECLDGATAIVVSDYAHGVMRRSEYLECLLVYARDKGIPVVVDTKSREALTMYRRASIVVPNSAEARFICGSSIDARGHDDAFLAGYIMDVMDLDAAAVTLGHGGAVMATRKWTRKFKALDEGDEEVVDVTGAGDTLAAALAAALGAGMPYDEAMKVAQAASGVVVQKLGVATVTAEEVREALKRYEGEGGREDVQKGRRAGSNAAKTRGVCRGKGEAREGASSRRRVPEEGRGVPDGGSGGPGQPEQEGEPTGAGGGPE